MEVIDNINHLLGDNLKHKITPGSNLKISVMQNSQQIQAEPSINDIVIGRKSVDWLTANGIMPRQWNIPPEEKSRITSAGIGLKISFSPVFIYDLSNHKSGSGKIIFFDWALLEKQLITNDEAAAFLIHEIGHSTNEYRFKNQIGSPEFCCEQAKRQKNPECDEYDADDYARHCGYAGFLVSGIQKMIDSGQPGFATPVNRGRIKRIEDKSEIQQHFLEGRKAML